MTHVYKVNPSLLLRVKPTFVLMDFMDYIGFIYQDQFYPIFCQVHPILSKSIHPPPPKKKKHITRPLPQPPPQPPPLPANMIFGGSKGGVWSLPSGNPNPWQWKNTGNKATLQRMVWNTVERFAWEKSKLRPFWGALTCLDWIPSRKFIQGCWKHVPGN